MNQVFKTVLLVALPASGKSEVRNFMANMDAEVLKEDFHIGENLQLDDFPYVHLMRRIDEELLKNNEERIYYPTGECFAEERDWGTLIRLLSEDYHNLVNRIHVEYEDAAELLFERFERASAEVGISPRLNAMSEETRKKVADGIREEADSYFRQLEAQYPETFEDKTIVIECARGGKDGSAMPLEAPFGYAYSLAQFSDEVLSDAAVLYIWVTPEESRRKNFARSEGNTDAGSNLFHGVPLAVMLGEYGCDDMQYLLDHSETADTITIITDDKKYHLPTGVFDNRVDKTSFLRADKNEWDAEKVEEVTQAIRTATDAMWKNYRK